MTSQKTGLGQQFSDAHREHTTGNLVSAITKYHEILEVNPAHFNACHLLGVALLQSGDYPGAIDRIGLAIEINDAVPDAHYNLAAALHRQGQIKEAIRFLHRALELKPDYPEAQLNLGVMLTKTNDQVAAESAYRAAIKLRPEFAVAHNNLGSLLEKRGDFEGAIKHWRLAIKSKPDFAEGYRNLAQHDPSNLQESDIATMERLVRDSSLSAKDKSFLGFALFEVKDSLGRHDEAFANLSNGNDLMCQATGYSLSAETSMVGALQSAFTPEVLKEGDQTGCQSEIPIFIVGMPRSGTSLVEQILASHPQVTGAGELTYIGELASKYIQIQDGRFLWNWSESGVDYAQLGNIYIEKLTKLALNGQRVTDKMPANANFIGFIKTILPKAKFIHVTRNPIDTCFACYRRRFDHGHGYSYDLTDLANYYKLHNALMDHWHQLMPRDIFRVSYEELVEQPRAVVEMILNHCDLDWEDDCLEFHKNKRLVKTSSAAQVRRPIYKSSVGRWKDYEQQLQRLIEQLTSVVTDV